MFKLISFKKNTNLLITILIVLTLLFFPYPLMILYQNIDSSLEGYNSFALTTSRGDIYNRDIIVYGNFILSVSNHPGLFLKDIITYEHQNEIVPLQGALPGIIHAMLYSLLKNISLTLIIGSIISTIIIIILLYFISELIQQKYKLSNSYLRTFLLIVSFFTFPAVLLSLFNFFFVKPILFRHYISYVSRFININHTVIFLLIWFLILIYIFFKEKNDKGLFILLGVSLASLQYSYVFFYMPALAFTLFSFILRDGLNKKTINKLLWVYIPWFILSFPYLINFILFSEFNKEFINGAGTSFIHPSFFGLLFKLFCVLFVFFIIDFIFLKQEETNIFENKFPKLLKESFLSISLFFTSLIVLNLKYLIGYTVQPYHFVYAFILPILIIITFIQFYKFLVIMQTYFGDNFKTYHLIKKIINYFIITFILILVLVSILYLIIFAKQNYVYYYFDDSDVELLNFIKTNTSEDAVFFADTTYTNDIIQVNTNRRTLLGQISLTRVPLLEIHSRLLFGYEKLGFSIDKLIEDVNYSSYYLPIFVKKVEELELDNPQENMNDIFDYYHNFYLIGSNQDGEKLISDLLIANTNRTQEFKLDYVIYSSDLEKFRDGNNIVFTNKKYVVKMVN